MKYISRIIVLAVALVMGLMTVSAQTVQVVMIQKVAALPATGSNYLDDPFRYFNVQFIANGVGADGLDIFFDMDFTVNASSFYFRTKRGTVPSQPIHLSEGVNIMKRDVLQTQFQGRLETNVFNNPLTAQQLPEGTYEMCVDVYLWSDRQNPARVPITLEPCHDFDICYSGSAPELVSPMVGAQIALNGAMVVEPARKVKFFWTPVISNCGGRNTRFKYQLKVVKVLNGQNYNDAIKYNPTVFSAEVRNNTFAILDTLRDVKVQMDRGALYVAQVQAEPIQDGRSSDPFVIANNGSSQPMPFFWDYNEDSRAYDYYLDEEDEEDYEEEGTEGLTLWEGGVEEVSELDDILDEAFPYERIVVLDPKRHYVESDGYYTIPVVNDIEVGFKPVYDESLKNVSYEIALYDGLDGDVDNITSAKPLFSEKMTTLPESRTLAGWGTSLKQGNRYYLQLSSNFSVSYWNYSIADTSFYVNEMLAQHVHNTISREFVEEEKQNTSGVFFQWGDNPDKPAFTTPQWKAPVDRSGDDIYDPVSYLLPASIPEVHKDGSFPVSWIPLNDVAKGDEVEYEVNVYELKPDQTLEEAVSENPVLVSRTVTDFNRIPKTDEEFFRVFSSKKTYVMTLSTRVSGESDTIYHFENGNESLPIIFRIVK